MIRTYLFTDGSCSGRGLDMGAWCAAVIMPNRRKLLYGTLYPTTINRCELLPMLAGLHWIRTNLDRRIPVRIYTDSEHTAQAIAGVFAPDENLDLWAAYHAIADDMTVECIWRERNSHPYMELCDSMASTLRKGQIEIATRLFDSWHSPEDDFPIVDLPHEQTLDIVGSIKAAVTTSSRSTPWAANGRQL